MLEFVAEEVREGKGEMGETETAAASLEFLGIGTAALIVLRCVGGAWVGDGRERRRNLRLGWADGRRRP